MSLPRLGANARLAPPSAIQTDLAVLTRLAGPVILSRLGVMVMGLTDALVVGRYSAVQLSYHALGWTPTAVVVSVSIALLTGIPVMTSRVIGEGRRSLAGAALRRGLAYAGLIGLTSSVLLFALGPLFLHALGLQSALADGASVVLLVFSASLIPNVLSSAMTLWLEAISRPAPAMAMMWLANGVNLVIDLVLVPGRLGAPALGAVGGACATLGARLFLMLGLSAYILLMRDARALGVFDKPARDRTAEAEQRRVGFGAGASIFFEVAAFSGMNIVAGWVGPLATAAYTIALNVVSVIFMVPFGLSTAAAITVGSAYGAGDLAGVNRKACVAFAVAGSFAAAMALIVWPLAGLLTRAYTRDPQVVAPAAGALALSCVFMVPDALQVVAGQVLRARGEVWVPTAAHFTSYAVVMWPLAWLFALPLHLGVTGIIVGTIVSSYVSASLLLGRFWILARRPSL